MTAEHKLVPGDAFAAGAQVMLEACVAEVRRSAAILRPEELAVALGSIPVRSLHPSEAAPPADLDPTERERAAGLVDELIANEPAGRGKLMLTIAARAIRRGRNLTAAEQLENLNNALSEGDA